MFIQPAARDISALNIRIEMCESKDEWDAFIDSLSDEEYKLLSTEQRREIIRHMDFTR